MAVICRLVSPTAMFFASEPITQPSSASASMISIRESTPSSEQESPSSSLSSVKTSPSPLLLSTSADSGGLYGGSTSFLKKSIVQQRRQFVSKPRHLFVHQPRQFQRRSSYGQGHPLTQQMQDHLHSSSQIIHPNRQHKKTRSIHLADKFQDAMSSPQLQSSLNGTFGNSETSAQARDDAQSEESDYVYTAPCEHHPSKGQTDYLINDMFPKLEHDLSTIEFGIRITDFMPLAFKTVSVSGLAERELELLRDIHCLPNVIQLQDSFVNDNGDTVLVLPMLKRFDCNAVNESICSVRKVIKQVLTGLAAVHAKNIVHLDINPSNLMVTHTKRDVIIIDFGLSTTVNRKGTNSIPVCGTTGYIAPEILNRQNYGDYDPTGADIYSLGIVLGEMLEPYIPDCDLHYFGSKYLAPENTKTTVSLLNGFISQTSVYPRVLIQAADLLKCMLEENPRERKSAQELLDCHPFFAACPGTEEPKATLKLCEWVCRVQEIKYQRYLCEEREECEVYRYR